MSGTSKVIYNGEYYDDVGGVIPIDNRGMLFGDGLFESIRIINGAPCFFDNHLNRLKMGLEAFSMNMPDGFGFEELEGELLKLIKKNKIKEGGRARITISRRSNGYYLPKHEDGVDYLIQAKELEDNSFSLNEKGLVVDIYTGLRKQVNRLAYYKSLNCQLYIVASLAARDSELDNVLITNENDCIIEFANSNLFIVSNGVLYTPPLADGCLGGTMRMQIINTALRHEIKVYETSLRPQNLLVADEVFMTNAIQGIQWVSSYRQKRYYHNMAQRLVEFLNSEVLNP